MVELTVFYSCISFLPVNYLFSVLLKFNRKGMHFSLAK